MPISRLLYVIPIIIKLIAIWVHVSDILVNTTKPKIVTKEHYKSIERMQ